MEKLVIIGGGIAGLSCLNALLDHDVSPLLLEGSTIGTPKMCGEFLAPKTAVLLENWDIGPLQKIHTAKFMAANKNFNISFPESAAAISRTEVELLLAQRARKKRGRIQENALIEKIIPATKNSPYIFYLKSGEIIEAESAIFATGKLGQETQTTMPLPYYGIKLHFGHIEIPNTLLMYSLKNAYLGIVPISNQTSNCACLIKKEEIEKSGSCKNYFANLLDQHANLNSIFKKIDLTKIDWFEGKSPDFIRKKIPSWPNAFWIGDALASFYPAIGSGFAHGISSAILAAEFYLQNKHQDYLSISHKIIKPKLQIGKLMHKLMLNPKLAKMIFPLVQHNAWLLNFFLKRLEYITQ